MDDFMDLDAALAQLKQVLGDGWNSGLTDSAKMYLEQAERLLLYLLPNLVNADDATKRVAQDVIVNAVARVFRNPTPGIRSEHAGQYSYQLDMSEVSASVRFTKSELGLLTGNRESEGVIGSASLLSPVSRRGGVCW